VKPLRPVNTQYSNYVEGYFKFLTDIASGAIQVSGDVLSQAYDQLFAFIYALRSAGDIEVEDERSIFGASKIDLTLSDFRAKLSNIESRTANIEKILLASGDGREHESKIDELTDKFEEFKDEVANLERTVKNLDTDITKILERIEKFFVTYTPILDRAKQEYEDMDRRVKS
jgi:predicted transcriptional regulator